MLWETFYAWAAPNPQKTETPKNLTPRECYSEVSFTELTTTSCYWVILCIGLKPYSSAHVHSVAQHLSEGSSVAIVFLLFQRGLALSPYIQACKQTYLPWQCSKGIYWHTACHQGCASSATAREFRECDWFSRRVVQGQGKWGQRTRVATSL